MEKIKTRGQGRVKKAVTRCLLIANCYLLFACANPADPPKTVAPPESGYGTVSVAFTGGLARTVFPVTVFENVLYAFARTDGGETPAEIEPANGVYTLPAGAWKVTVTAYKGAVSETNKAAAGELSFDVADGEHKQIRVPLSAAKETGRGKFSYGIQYPEDAVAAITLVSLAEPPAGDDSYDPAVTLYPETSEPIGGNKITFQTEFELDAGFYMLSVQLTLGSVMSAGKNEVVLVYDKLTSEFGTAENPIVFTMQDFAFPLPAAPGTPMVTPFCNGWLTVTWTEVPSATAYEVWYTPDDGSPQQWGGDISDTSTTITGLTIGTAYEVLVKAKNRAGAGEPSESASVTPYKTELYVGDSATPEDIYLRAGATALDKAFDWIAENAEQDASYTIVVGKDETHAAKTFNADSVNNVTGVTITLEGDGQERTIQRVAGGSLYTVSAITLVVDSGITLRGVGSGTLSVVTVSSGGSLFMEDGSKITGNSNVNGTYGGGVNVGSGGAFTMNGGEISGNNVQFGGGVSVSGTFTMRGGEISGNSAGNKGSAQPGYGGGVYVQTGGVFTMYGGKISGNTIPYTSSFGGAGVYLNTGSTFNMSGGEISGNTSTATTCLGGGVYGYFGSTFIMYGGEISNNIANGHGGGVYINSQSGKVGTFTMYGGKISGNSNTKLDGGGVFLNSVSTFTMHGGEISGNTAVRNGGGVIGSSSAIIKKQPATGQTGSGIIYGYDESDPKSNNAVSGKAVYIDSSKKREKTVGATQSLDSALTGSDGGWTE